MVFEWAVGERRQVELWRLLDDCVTVSSLLSHITHITYLLSHLVTYATNPGPWPINRA